MIEENDKDIQLLKGHEGFWRILYKDKEFIIRRDSDKDRVVVTYQPGTRALLHWDERQPGRLSVHYHFQDCTSYRVYNTTPYHIPKKVYDILMDGRAQPIHVAPSGYPCMAEDFILDSRLSEALPRYTQIPEDQNSRLLVQETLKDLGGTRMICVLFDLVLFIFPDGSFIVRSETEIRAYRALSELPEVTRKYKTGLIPSGLTPQAVPIIMDKKLLQDWYRAPNTSKEREVEDILFNKGALLWQSSYDRDQIAVFQDGSIIDLRLEDRSIVRRDWNGLLTRINEAAETQKEYWTQSRRGAYEKLLKANDTEDIGEAIQALKSQDSRAILTNLKKVPWYGRSIVRQWMLDYPEEWRQDSEVSQDFMARDYTKLES